MHIKAEYNRLRDYFNTDLGRHAFIFILLSGVFLVSFIYYPPDEPRFTVCIFKSLSGLDCPGCGLTRSFCALSKGHLAKAFYFNKLGPFLYVIFAGAWLRALLTLLKLKAASMYATMVMTRFPLAKIGVFAFATYWVARTALHFAGYHI
jgi:hypothetical protein